MRPAFYRCPNYSRCTIGYRGEDLEIVEGMVAVCPECDTALQPRPKRRGQIAPLVINLLTIALLATAMWFLWPKLVQFWQWLTANPTPTRS